MCDYQACEFKIRNENVMKTHVVREHGISYRNKYQLISAAGPFTSLKRGQTKCSHCGTYHNNRSRPDYCACGHDLLRIKHKQQLSPFKLIGQIYSVRKNVHGLCKRVIVDYGKKLCFNEECRESRVHYSDTAKFNCVHL